MSRADDTDLLATLPTIDRWVAYRVWHSRLPGAQVAIGQGDRVLFSRAHGLADAERRSVSYSRFDELPDPADALAG